MCYAFIPVAFYSVANDCSSNYTWYLTKHSFTLKVSSPGADRILKVPDDLTRFEDMPMRVSYTENIESNCREVDGVFFLDSIEKDSETCVWKLADVKENRDPTKKGKPLNRKQKDWRLRLSFDLHRMVTLYVDY